MRKRSYHHGDLRRALLDATLKLALERGAGGITLREAARVAGVSQTAPYRHFPDKRTMLAAASEEGFRVLLGEMEQALETARDPPMLALAVSYVKFALHHPAHFHLMFGHGSPPKSATPSLQQAARLTFQLFFGIAAHAWGRRRARGALFRTWALAHGVACLALERQILFDLGEEALLRSARAALEAQLASVT